VSIKESRPGAAWASVVKYLEFGCQPMKDLWKYDQSWHHEEDDVWTCRGKKKKTTKTEKGRFFRFPRDA